MLRIEVQGSVEQREVVSKAGDKFLFREQKAWLFLPGDKYPRPFRIRLSDGQSYEPGMYQLSPASFSVGGYGDLLVRPVLEVLPPKGNG